MDESGGKEIGENHSDSSQSSSLIQNTTVNNLAQQRRVPQISNNKDTESIFQIDGQKSGSQTHQPVHDYNTNSKQYATQQLQRENYPQTLNFDTTQKQTNIGSAHISNDDNINQQNDNSKQDSIQIPKVLNRFSTLPESSTFRTLVSRNENKQGDATRKPLNYYIYDSDLQTPLTTDNIDLKREEISTEIYNEKTKLRIEPIYHRNAQITTSTEDNTNAPSLEKIKSGNIRNVIVEPNSSQGAQNSVTIRPKHYREIVLSTTEPLKANLDNNAVFSHVTNNPWTDFRNLVSSTIAPNRFRNNRVQDIQIISTPKPTSYVTPLPNTGSSARALRTNYHFDTSTQPSTTEANIESSTVPANLNIEKLSPAINRDKSANIRKNIKESLASQSRASANRFKIRPIVRQPSPFMTKKNSDEVVKDSQESESITQLRRKPFLFDEKPLSSISETNKQNQRNFVTDSTLLVNSRRAFKEGLNKTREVQRTTVSPYKSLETIRTTFDDKTFGVADDAESITKRLNLDEPKFHFDDSIDIPTTFRPNIKYILTSEASNFEDKDLVFEVKTQTPETSQVSSSVQPVDDLHEPQSRGRYSLPIIDHSTTTEEIWKEPTFRSRFSFTPRSTKTTTDPSVELRDFSTEKPEFSLPENKSIYDIPGGVLVNKNGKNRISDNTENKNNRGYIKHKYFLDNLETSTITPQFSTHPPYKQKFRATVEIPNVRDINQIPQIVSTTDAPTTTDTHPEVDISNRQTSKDTVTTFRPRYNDQKPVSITNATKTEPIRTKTSRHTTKRPMTDEERFKMEYEQIRSDLTHASRHHANLGRPKGDSKSGYRRTEPLFRREQASSFNEGSIVKLRTDLVRSKINSQRDKNILGRMRPSPTDSSNEDKADKTTEKPLENLGEFKIQVEEKLHNTPTKIGFITSKSNYDDKLSVKENYFTDKTSTESSIDFDEIKAYIDQLNIDEASVEEIEPEENPRQRDHTKIYLRPKINYYPENYTNQIQESQDVVDQTRTHLEQNYEPTPTVLLDHTKLYLYENQTSLEQKPKDLIPTYAQQNVTSYNQQVPDQNIYDADTDLGILKTSNQKPVSIPAIPSRATRVNADIRQMINSRNRDQNLNKDPVRCSKDNSSTRCNEVIAVTSATTRYIQTDCELTKTTRRLEL